jgi:FkbM family methyltransferase
MILYNMREIVTWAYRILLGREPESEDVIDLYSKCESVDELVGHFIRSREFQLRHLWGSEIGALVPFEKQFVMTELPDGTRFWINMHDRYVSRAIHLNDYEQIETSFIRKTVRPGMRVLDIGANLGWFTVQMAKMVGPCGHVTSFEPRCDLFHYLSRTVRENKLGNVSLHNCALGGQDGEAELRWPADGVNPGGTQLNMTAVMSRGMLYQKTPMRVLDDEISEDVNFIKIDVEGAEKLVFSGAKRILTKIRPVILSELAPDALRQVSNVGFDEYMAFLQSLGYTAYQLTEQGEVGKQLIGWPYSDPSALMNVILLPNT